MEFKEFEKLIESFKNKPLKTFCMFIVFLFVIAISVFIKSYVNEKGKEAAKQPKEGVKVEQSYGDLSFKLKETKPGSTVTQYTEGNQAPIVNVSPGGKSIISYGSEALSTNTPPAVLKQPILGIVLDQDGEPLSGVKVTILEYELSDLTNGQGKFSFEIKGENNSSVRLMAQKQGFKTHRQDATLGNTNLSFKMEPKL